LQFILQIEIKCAILSNVAADVATKKGIAG